MGLYNYTRRIKIGLIILFVWFSLFKAKAVLALNLKDAFGKPLNDVSESAGYARSASAESLIGLGITTILTFVGVIFLLLAIYGGYIWMIARGNEQEVERAKEIIKNSLIGLVVVIAAYAISWFIINALGNTALKLTE